MRRFVIRTAMRFFVVVALAAWIAACADSKSTREERIRDAAAAGGYTAIDDVRVTTTANFIARCPEAPTYVGIFKGKDANGAVVVGQMCCSNVACTILRVERVPSALQTSGARTASGER